jgi:hypothetical protein
MTRFVLHNENASIFDTSNQMQPMERFARRQALSTQAQALNSYSSMSP